MLNAGETILIRDLAATLGKSAGFVVEQYAMWLMASALGWIALGLGICWAAKRLPFDEDSAVAAWGQWLIRGVVMLVGALFILANVPDLASPTAAATHKLMRDIRGR